MDDSSIDLSVIVPVYNGEPFIERTLGRLTEYVASLNEPAELIVIDDGSTDRTGELIEKSIADAPARVEVIRSPQNEGKGAAIQRGMAAARGRLFLAMTDGKLLCLRGEN